MPHKNFVKLWTFQPNECINYVWKNATSTRALSATKPKIGRYKKLMKIRVPGKTKELFAGAHSGSHPQLRENSRHALAIRLKDPDAKIFALTQTPCRKCDQKRNPNKSGKKKHTEISEKSNSETLREKAAELLPLTTLLLRSQPPNSQKALETHARTRARAIFS